MYPLGLQVRLDKFQPVAGGRLFVRKLLRF